MELFLVDFQKVHAVVDDFAAFDYGVVCGDTDDGLVGYGFSAAGLADDGQRFSLIEVEADVSDGLHFARAGAEGYFQVFYFKFLFHILVLRTS